ncbi:MAG: cytochrome b/b6 domain-containing protein [Bacteroidia bacterium]|nr:cytochrome b/b6 domain-containing protein [Bacteroidia bacterium]
MENRNYSLIYRIMHWAIAITMLLILFTIFLRLTWMNRDNMANIIKNYLSTTDKTLSEKEIMTLARQIRKPMWDWHIYLGYVLTGLYIVRISLPFFGQMKYSNPLRKELSGKLKFQFWVYIVFYLCLATSLFTGLMIEFGPESLEKPMEEIHVLSIYYLVTFLILHIGGVLLAEFTSDKGILSRIVSGEKKK